MPIKNPLQCILLWLILIVMMILHFNYNVGKIFYGVDVAREGADGTVPMSVAFIRMIYYHLPVVWILILMRTNATWIKLGLFLISIVYTLSHAAHLVGEVMVDPDLSQTPLLSLTLIVSIVLSIEHFRYWKAK
ncbi:MAG: hypothetical protein AAGI23_21855 [Bacteroidota bacterium]